MADSNLHPFHGQWEKRWHPLRQEWIVYAAHRNNRPWNFNLKSGGIQSHEYDANCYLCPGNRRVNGAENPDYQDVFIFENDHPVVGLNAPEIETDFAELHGGLYKRSRATGIAKVVCYDRRHNVSLTDLDISQIKNVFISLRGEMDFFAKTSAIKSVLIFENKGEIVGVSNPHPHCQIYATDFIFNLFQKELDAAESWKKENDTNLFAEIIQAEQRDGIRVIAENDHAIAFIPFFARFAYEAYIFPKKKHATLSTMNDDELEGMAQVFQTLTRKYDANFKTSFPYVMAFAQAPVDGGVYEEYHLHLLLCPPLRQPGLPKFLAGPETGADTFMADTMPEEKAAELRRIQL